MLPSRLQRRGGFVLVMALAALALMMVLLLALLQGSSHQIRGAQSDAAFAREKMLADSAVALVIGQIGQASTQPGQAWISQPGLLRTYDTTATRQPTRSYKLYSSASMTDSSGTLQFLTNDLPADWNSTANRSFYTDLNAPVQGSFFSRSIYPILDPAAETNVEGVSVDPGHDVEMPVAWLYELQDGTLGPAANATKANPIVGRIAFWTDDESCKINLNTAGAESPWAPPHANSADDVAWSTTQPAAGEFARYPGHPASTSLAPVFGSLSPQQLLGLTPRYAFGGSEFGVKATNPNETLAPKTDRLYASIDELCFGTGIGANGLRTANPVDPAQLDEDRFVLTAHSNSPETTLLGEPRIAIWPVSDVPGDSTRTTAIDRAIENAATVGTRPYFFKRHNVLSATDDLSSTFQPDNARLFNELLARGAEDVPGYGAHFTQKYQGLAWNQLMLELTDFIRGLNAVDPSPAPFVPFAAGDSTGLGHAFVIPLTLTDSATGTVMRGLGRSPTLSSLTLVFYVSGFGYLKPGGNETEIDYTATPDDANGTSWKSNFLPNSPLWPEVNRELIRAFVVPCTFQPGCGYPEVSDACSLQISGLDGIQASSGSASGGFGFAPIITSPLLGTPLKAISDRAWGGNEGPIPWRLTGDQLAAQGSGAATYPFAGPSAFRLPVGPFTYSSATQSLTLPAPFPLLTFNGLQNLKVRILDGAGNVLQTFTLNWPACTMPAPTINDEGAHRDGATPSASSGGWDASATTLAPSYYMNLENRLLATQRSRPFMIQPGDASRSMEAATDLRVIASLPNVPATFFQPHPNYLNMVLAAHNLRFADGTSACGASGLTRFVSLASYPTGTTNTVGTDWSTGNVVPVTGAWLTAPPCTVPSGTRFVVMAPGISGDWDTGPGIAPDGALINLPDAGSGYDPTGAYFSLEGGLSGSSATRFAPNALVPSPVVFGSLPAGINPVAPDQSEPWRTLLFGPFPAGDAAHPGFATPPDHLLLDHFWMPAVEPYALSTCMTTAGKINLNDQIAPFTYLHRSTALHALLRSIRIPAIPVSQAGGYKLPAPAPAIPSIWNKVDENMTIAEIEQRFTNGDAYLSESEICTVPLVPENVAVPSLDAFWKTGNGGLTGDNLRELPYALLYGRLTTRSNSYTVHVRAQVLQKLSGDPEQNVWKEGADLVLGDWRGSYEIERYLDPKATAPTTGKPQLGPYLFRIVSSRRFAP